MAIMKTPLSGMAEDVGSMSGQVRPYPFFAQPLKTPPVVEDDLVKQLREIVVGQAISGSKPQVLGRTDKEFASAATIFNGAVKTPALALVRPTNASDVSRTVIFCREHNLNLSVKGGGHGVHGWSVAGHVIVDLCLMNDVTVSLPDTSAPTLQESFERLQLRRASPSNDDTDRRPSLASSHFDSSESGAKRNADSMVGDHNMDGTSADGARRKSKVDGERVDYSSLSSIEEKRSRSSSTTDGERSGSGSSGGSRCGEDATSISTPPTSVSERSPREDGIPRQPEAGPSGGPRFTYVNPSQRPTKSLPFAPTTIGPGSGPSSFGNGPNLAFGGQKQQLFLNTNPDPPPYTIVSFGAGTHSKQLDAATAASPYGAFHVPTSAFPVGAGQFLSGGFGFLGRKHGMAMDNVVEVEMVLADGRIVWVGQGGAKGGDWKEDEDPEEVWWGIRGAGSILGVVTRFRAKAYYVPSVFAGNLIYLFDRTTAPSLMRHVRDCIKGSPRTLYTNMILTAGPPGAPAIIVLQLCFSGSRAEGELYVQAISSWDGGRSLFQDFSERSFERQQLAVEEVLKGGHGKKWYIKSDMLLSLSDEVIDNTCARFNSVPDGCTWLFEYTGGGAVADVKDSCFPTSHRESSFTVAALHQWAHDETPIEDTRCVTTAEDWINEVIHPNSPGGPLPCFLQSNRASAVAAVYGVNFSRLRALKMSMDPDNFFRHATWPTAVDGGVDGLEELPDGDVEGGEQVHAYVSGRDRKSEGGGVSYGEMEALDDDAMRGGLKDGDREQPARDGDISQSKGKGRFS